MTTLGLVVLLGVFGWLVWAFRRHLAAMCAAVVGLAMVTVQHRRTMAKLRRMRPGGLVGRVVSTREPAERR